MKTVGNIVKHILGTRKGVKDIDGDGVPNSKDCEPRNPFRQDFIGDMTKRNMQKVGHRLTSGYKERERELGGKV